VSLDNVATSTQWILGKARLQRIYAFYPSWHLNKGHILKSSCNNVLLMLHKLFFFMFTISVYLTIIRNALNNSERQKDNNVCCYIYTHTEKYNNIVHHFPFSLCCFKIKVPLYSFLKRTFGCMAIRLTVGLPYCLELEQLSAGWRVWCSAFSSLYIWLHLYFDYNSHGILHSVRSLRCNGMEKIKLLILLFIWV